MSESWWRLASVNANRAKRHGWIVCGSTVDGIYLYRRTRAGNVVAMICTVSGGIGRMAF